VIRFQCTCGKPLKVDDSVAGRTVQCPHCGNQVRAPAGHGTSRTRARAAEPRPMSGPAALQAALREAGEGTAADDVPMAEVVGDPPAGRRSGSPVPPEAAQAIRGLDALAQAAGPAPAKPARRPAKPKARTRKATRTPDRAAVPNGRPPPGAEHSKKAAIIGAVAAVVVLVIAIIAASFIGGGKVEPEKPAAAESPPVTTTAERPTRKGYAFDQPGALFGGRGEVHEDTDTDGTSGQP